MIKYGVSEKGDAKAVIAMNARFIVLPHWDNMSQAHMLPSPIILTPG